MHCKVRLTSYCARRLSSVPTKRTITKCLKLRSRGFTGKLISVSRFCHVKFDDKKHRLFGAKAIVAACPAKGWNLSTVKICRRVDKRGQLVAADESDARQRTSHNSARRSAHNKVR